MGKHRLDPEAFSLLMNKESFKKDSSENKDTNLIRCCQTKYQFCCQWQTKSCTKTRVSIWTSHNNYRDQYCYTSSPGGGKHNLLSSSPIQLVDQLLPLQWPPHQHFQPESHVPVR